MILSFFSFSLPALVVISSGFAGCGPTLRDKLAVPDITVPKSSSKLPEEVRTLIFVDQFTDSRISHALVEEEGKESGESEGDVGLVVQSAVAAAFREKGFTVTDDAPVALSGKVKSWKARVQGGLGAKAEGEAVLALELFDPANRRVFSGEYSGSAMIKAGSMNEDDVRKCLGLAMAQAIAQVVSDQKLTRLLLSF